MKVLQILPELNSGGVERGTLEIAAALIREGHEAVVLSNGGRLVAALEKSGARHITLPVHRKSLTTLLQVINLRRILMIEKPDILHIRSRVPGWVAWLAWRTMDPKNRPRLVSTVHGFYSVNRYSAVMTQGERVIAVSESIRTYILKNYPRTPIENIRVIHRGVASEEFPLGYRPDENWMRKWQETHPHLQHKKLLLLPGRITRWKGQEEFIRLIAALKHRGVDVHGLIAGETHLKKRAFAQELKTLTQQLGISDAITFLGHRNDIKEIMSISSIVFSLSRDPEAFGRVSLEAMSLGIAVIGNDHGGVAEQLSIMFPAGLVSKGDSNQLINTTIKLLNHSQIPKPVATTFTKTRMCRKTLDIYQDLQSMPRP